MSSIWMRAWNEKSSTLTTLSNDAMSTHSPMAIIMAMSTGFESGSVPSNSILCSLSLSLIIETNLFSFLLIVLQCFYSFGVEKDDCYDREPRHQTYAYITQLPDDIGLTYCSVYY